MVIVILVSYSCERGFIVKGTQDAVEDYDFAHPLVVIFKVTFSKNLKKNQDLPRKFDPVLSVPTSQA